MRQVRRPQAPDAEAHLSLVRELDGVLQQIEQNLFQAHGIDHQVARQDRIAVDFQGQSLVQHGGHHALLACDACGASFDPIRFLDQLDETFEEIYADIPIDRM